MIKMFAFLSIIAIPWPTQSVQKSLEVPSVASSFNQLRETQAFSREEDHLDVELVRIITRAKRINVYHLKPFLTDAAERQKKKRYFADYEVLDKKKVNKKRTSDLKSALLDEANYITEHTNKCTFTATIGLEIVLRKERLNVLISYRCGKLIFVRENIERSWEVRSLERFDRLARGLFKGQLT